MSYHFLKKVVCPAASYPTLIVLFLALQGCGYTFQSSKNQPFFKERIQKIYVAPVLNNTYKAGVEIVVYNNVVRSLSSHGRVQLVQNLEDSDAILQGRVTEALYTGSGARASVSGLNPIGLGANLPTSNYTINTEYIANLTCSFTLIRKAPALNQSSTLWSANFSRNQLFPASNQLDVPGTTSALINESEFDRALSDIARRMMDDVHESMLAMF